MRSVPASLLAAAALAAALASPRPASADASAWFSVSAGATRQRYDPASESAGLVGTAERAALAIDVGAGTTPDRLFIFGGLFRVAPVLGRGTDLELVARAATHGFQSGVFGVALDAGGYYRGWAGDAELGLSGALVLGGPLGLQLSLRGQKGEGEAYGLSALAGIDVLRLTVYRQNFLDWLPNPYPAQTRRASR